MEKKEFQAESKRMLELMIHSIYTHKEIFLRELISNASDAIEKLNYRSLTDENVGMNRDDFAITLTVDREARTLTVSDNGIGMNAEDLEKDLGVIAASGSGLFKKELAGKGASPEIEVIGQFGVGFYSAFMVADHIRVLTKKYGEEGAWLWESSGADGYTVEPAEKATVGTEITLHIREDGEEKDEYSRFLREYTLEQLVRKYSDYVRYPIRMLMPHSVKKEGSSEEKPEYEEVYEYETLNSMLPLWKRGRFEVTKEEYESFYQEHFADPEAPRLVITASVEGNVSYQALLFVPAKAPFNYGTEQWQKEAGVQLYSAGVMIMDPCRDLLPEEFSFVRGVVESPDLSLNISRELLQHDRQLKLIASNLEKKIRTDLLKLQKDDRASYEAFYETFGRQIKVGALEDGGAKKDKLQDLLLFYSSSEKKPVTLSEYVSRMKEDQKYIYYLSGESASAVDRMPQTEILKDRGMEILYFTDRADEFLADTFYSYQEIPFRSAADDNLGLPEEEKKDTKKYEGTFAFIKETLGDKVSEVVASSRLKTHPVCLSSGDGVTFEMEKYFAAVRPDLDMKARRILEINTDHAAFKALEKARETDPEKAAKYAEILYSQAVLIAGLPLEDPSGYTDLLCSLW